MSGKFVVLILFLIGATNGESDCTIQDCCNHPSKSVDRPLNWTLTMDPGLLKNLYVVYGNKAARLHMAQYMNGKILSDEEVDDMRICARYSVSTSDNMTKGNPFIYYGFGGKQTESRCRFSLKDQEVVICNYIHRGLNYTENNVLKYFTYRNNKNLAVAVKCFPNGDSGWIAISTSPTIDIDEKEKILDHVKTLGFDPADIVPVHSELC